jgi:hypothetical protein
MAALLVTYDLKKPGQDYKDFYATIKSYGWARLSESSYAIATTEAPKAIMDKLLPYVDKNDTLFVMTLGQGWHGLGSQEVYDWLKRNL